MKMTPEHYQHLRKLMLPLKERIINHRAWLFGTKLDDLEKRLRWDAYKFAGGANFSCNVLYKYLNDGHIDTALKAIMKEIDK